MSTISLILVDRIGAHLSSHWLERHLSLVIKYESIFAEKSSGHRVI